MPSDPVTSGTQSGLLPTAILCAPAAMAAGTMRGLPVRA